MSALREKRTKFPSTGPSGGQTSQFKVREWEVEQLRKRGQASCAECRRCKLKCDKKVPCSACLRRGYQSICPNGVLSSGSGSRFVVVGSDKMRKKMVDMSLRIRQLEDSLSILQAAGSAHQHPLLSDEHLSIKVFDREEVVERNGSNGASNSDAEPAAELSNAFGTLAITDKGEMRFMGRASNETLFMTNGGKPRENVSDLPSDPPGEGDAAMLFPFAPAHHSRAEVLRHIEARLPSYERTTALLEAYLTHVAWFSRLVQREQVMEEVLPTVYGRGSAATAAAPGSNDAEKPGQSSGAGRGVRSCDDTVYVHRLALFFAILACSATADVTLLAQDGEAARYNALTRAAMSVRPVFDGTSLESVQTIVLLANYQFYSCRTMAFEPAWKTLIFGMTLGVSIGLHRDPSRWTMDSKTQERRRTIFWELFSLDKWKSLESGRPSIFNIAEIDCEFPTDTEGAVDPDGILRPSYWRWRNMFAKEVIGPIAEYMALAKQIKYAEILELDRKVREFNARPVPTELMGATTDLGSIIRRSTQGGYREIALLSLHRNFFARAMLEDPDKALSGPFSASVLAAYACSISLLKLMRTQYILQSPLLIRQWFLWVHSLIAGVIVGTVAVKSHSPAAVSAAQNELQAAIELFEHAHVHPIAQSGLPILRRLLDKSRYRHQIFGPPGLDSAAPTEGLYGADWRSADADEELRILGGEARTVKFSAEAAASQAVSVAPGKRSNDLFPVDASSQSVFCAPSDSNGSAQTQLNGAPDSSIDFDANSHFDLGLPNFLAHNIGIGTGADGITEPPPRPAGSAAGPGGHFSGAGLDLHDLPEVPLPSDPQALLGMGFFGAAEGTKASETGRLNGVGDAGVGAGAGASFGEARSDAGVDVNTLLGLGTFEASNNSFDFLMDDVLSATMNDVVQQDAVAQGGAVADTWQALMENMWGKP